MEKIKNEIMINIAYDKVHQCYIAYNTEAQIVTTGVCVNVAKDNFKKIAKSKKLKVIEYDYK